LSSWDLAFCGAEPVRPRTLERFARRFSSHGLRPEALYPCFGLAESCVFVSGGRKGSAPTIRAFDRSELDQGKVILRGKKDIDAEGSRRLVGCGAGRLGTEIRIVDPEAARPCRPDEVGEVWVSGGSVGEGYWNRPVLSQRTFQAVLDSGTGPYLRTGDLGFIDGGHLFIAGRAKDMVIAHGSNHHAEDVEDTVVQAAPDWLRPGCGAVFAVDHPDEQVIVVHEVKRRSRADEGSTPGGSGSAKPDLEEICALIRQAVSRDHGLRCMPWSWYSREVCLEPRAARFSARSVGSSISPGRSRSRGRLREPDAARLYRKTLNRRCAVRRSPILPLRRRRARRYLRWCGWPSG